MRRAGLEPARELPRWNLNPEAPREHARTATKQGVSCERRDASEPLTTARASPGPEADGPPEAPELAPRGFPVEGADGRARGASHNPESSTSNGAAPSGAPRRVGAADAVQLGRLAGELAVLLGAGDVDAARLVHEKIGAALRPAEGAAVVDLEAERARRARRAG